MLTIISFWDSKRSPYLISFVPFNGFIEIQDYLQCRLEWGKNLLRAFPFVHTILPIFHSKLNEYEHFEYPGENLTHLSK